MLLIAIFVLLLMYVFGAGLLSTWLHFYLIATSKGGEFYHDHRICTMTSILWPFLFAIILFYNFYILLKKIYYYPYLLYVDIYSRRKKLLNDKK